MTFTFDAPLPPTALHPNNSGCHRMKKARAIKRYRADVAWLARVARPKGWNSDATRYSLELRFLHATNRRRDDDGSAASFKAGRDAMTDAAIWPDDSCVTMMPVKYGLDAKTPRLVITVTILEES